MAALLQAYAGVFNPSDNKLYKIFFNLGKMSKNATQPW